MIIVDEKVINLIEKLRKALLGGQLEAEKFPIEEVANLIECALGETFWKCVGSRPCQGFNAMPVLYTENLKAALKRGDREECGRILSLFSYSYQAFYTALSEEEKVFREKPYRQMIIDLGMFSSRLQCRLHEKRQEQMSKSNRETCIDGSGRGAVYTCLTGDKILHQPKEFSAALTYLCFTREKEKVGKKDGAWEYCLLPETEEWRELPDDLTEFRCQSMPHKLLPDYDFSIWTSPEVIMQGDVLQFSRVYGNGNSMLCFPNPAADCIYEDMSVTHMGTDERNIAIRKSLARYEREGFPKHYGLIDSRIMIRSHHDDMLCYIMEEWWKEAEEKRANVKNAFNYMAWKHEFAFSLCDLFIYENPYFKISDIDLDTHEEF